MIRRILDKKLHNNDKNIIDIILKYKQEMEEADKKKFKPFIININGNDYEREIFIDSLLKKYIFDKIIFLNCLKYIRTSLNIKHLMNILDNLELEIKNIKIVIFIDLDVLKYYNDIINIFTSYNNLEVSLVFLSKSYEGLSLTLRRYFNKFIFFKTKNKKEIKIITKELSGFMGKILFKKIFEESTQDSYFTINYKERSRYKYSKNEIIPY